MTQSTYLRREQAAAYLQERYGAYTTETLAKLATIGGGPPFVKFGRFPLYRPEDLETWAISRMSPKVRTTSELSAAHNENQST